MALPAVVMKAAWLLVKNPKTVVMVVGAVTTAVFKAGEAMGKSKSKK